MNCLREGEDPEIPRDLGLELRGMVSANNLNELRRRPWATNKVWCWPTPWVQPRETDERSQQKCDGLLTHRNCEIVNVFFYAAIENTFMRQGRPQRVNILGGRSLSVPTLDCTTLSFSFFCHTLVLPRLDFNCLFKENCQFILFTHFLLHSWSFP